MQKNNKNDKVVFCDGCTKKCDGVENPKITKNGVRLLYKCNTLTETSKRNPLEKKEALRLYGDGAYQY